MKCPLTISLLLGLSAAHGAQYSIPSFKVAGGGRTSTGGPYSLSGTAGQHDAAGPMTPGGGPGSFALSGGFWNTAFFVLTVNVAGSGSVTKSPDQVHYTLGSTVTLTAVPDCGYIFTGWSGGASGTINPLTVTFGPSRSITANFVQPPAVVVNDSDSGAGSLRQAIANVAACGGSFIIFAPNVTGLITLTNGELFLTQNMTIGGPGAKSLTVSGNNASRVFNIGSGIAVSISGLTIANGLAAGALGGGIFNNHATLTLSDCAISGNSAQEGAGIYNYGLNSGSSLLTITNCTISGNSAVSIGGGIVNDGSGGGSATLAITNSTLSGNSGSVGGIYNNGANSGSATLKLFSCTLSGNSGVAASAIFNEAASGAATLEVGNSILKADSSGANLVNDAGTITSRGYNLSSDAAGGDGTHGPGGLLNATGDQRNTDPMLDPAGLHDNGGNTLTIALLPGSPAVDAGKSFGSGADQRGRTRPFDIGTISNASGGDGSDIGAYELIPPTLNGSRSGNSVLASWPSASPGFGLQQNENLANPNGWSAFGGTINDDGTTKSVTITGPTGTLFFRLKQQ